MPELPEVETIRRGLMRFIVGDKLKKTTILCEKSFIGKPIVGTVVEVRRFGKALVIDFDNGWSILAHLRMTGQLIYDSKSGDVVISAGGAGNAGGVHGERYAAGHPSENFVAELPNKQTRVILEFERGMLYFNDQRKFGFMKVMQTSEVASDKFVQKLAPEPWKMTGEELYARLQRHGGAVVKAVILDQTVVCGLGNIYADEALFRAGIHPARRAGSVSLTEAKALIAAAREVMEKSIEAGGSTMATYVKADGTRGDYLDNFAQVFGRTGEACVQCGTPIIKIRVAGRGTHICPECQKMEAGDD